MRDENDDISSEDDSNLSDVEEEDSDEDGDDSGSNQVMFPQDVDGDFAQAFVVGIGFVRVLNIDEGSN